MIRDKSFNVTTGTLSNGIKVLDIPLFTVLSGTCTGIAGYAVPVIVIRGILAFQMRELGCNRLRDLYAVKTAIFDENLAGVHARDNHARQVNT